MASARRGSSTGPVESRSVATAKASTRTIASQTSDSQRLSRKPLPTERIPLAGSPTKATHIWWTSRNPRRKAAADGLASRATSTTTTVMVETVLAIVPDRPRRRGRELR